MLPVRIDCADGVVVSILNFAATDNVSITIQCKSLVFI